MLYKWVALRARNCTHPLLVLRPSSSSSWAVVAETVPKSYRVRAAKLVPRLETSFSIRDGGIVARGGDRRVAIAPADLMTFLVTKKKVDIPPQVLAEVFSEVQTITTSLPLSENSKTILEQSAVFASSETALQRLKAKAKPRSSTKVYEIAEVMNLKDDVNKSMLNEEDRTDDDSFQTNKDNDFTKTGRKSNTHLKSLFGTVNGSPTIDQALYLSKRKCAPVSVQHKSLNPKRAVKIKEKRFVPINKVKKLESEVEMKSSWIYRKEETGTNFDELHPPASQINMNRTGYLFLFL